MNMNGANLDAAQHHHMYTEQDHRNQPIGEPMWDFDDCEPGVSPSPVNSANDARDLAIDWQHWSWRRAMSWGELAAWRSLFEHLAGVYGLADEFRENGII